MTLLITNNDIPQCLREAPVQILRAQTTFLDLCAADGSNWRLHLRSVHERHGGPGDASFLHVSQEHPLLMDFQEQWLSLYVSKSTAEPAVALQKLADITKQWSAGWRDLHRYLNGASMAETVLTTGFGQILHAPSSLVRLVQESLVGLGIDAHVLERPTGPKPGTSPMIASLGDRYLIADQFLLEKKQRIGIEIPFSCIIAL